MSAASRASGAVGSHGPQCSASGMDGSAVVRGLMQSADQPRARSGGEGAGVWCVEPRTRLLSELTSSTLHHLL